MWSWLLLGGVTAIFATGVPKAVYNWVLQQLTYVISAIGDAITAIWNAIQQIWNDIYGLWGRITAFIASLLTTVYNWVQSLINSTIGWVQRLWNDLWNFVNGIWSWVISKWAELYSLIIHSIDDIRNWVYSNIYLLLKQYMEDGYRFLTHAISRIAMYIDHPELLVKLLAGYLWSVWLDLAKQFGGLIIRWIIRTTESAAGEFFDLLETILSSII